MEDTQNTFPPSDVPQQEESSHSWKKILFSILGTAILLGVAVAGYVYFGANERGADPVARVNGEEITRRSYDNSIRGLQESAVAQGFDTADPAVQEQIRTQALTSLVNGTLLLQAATEAGVVPTDADVQTEYDNLVQALGGEGELAARLEENSITEAELRKDLADQLAIGSYLRAQFAATSTTPTDEEVVAAYEVLSSASSETPELGTIRQALIERLRAEKEQGILLSILQSLRQNASIEILI